jgi:hypothetical protein
MVRAVRVDVLDGGLDGGDSLDGQGEREELGPEVVFRCRVDVVGVRGSKLLRDVLPCGSVAFEEDLLREEGCCDCWPDGGQRLLVNE